MNIKAASVPEKMMKKINAISEEKRKFCKSGTGGGGTGALPPHSLSYVPRIRTSIFIICNINKWNSSLQSPSSTVYSGPLHTSMMKTFYEDS